MYQPDVAPFAAIDPENSGNVSGIIDLLSTGLGGLTFMQAAPVAVPQGTIPVLRARGVQMCLEQRLKDIPRNEITALLPKDVPDMLRLVSETEPGPFFPHTHLLGTYWGVFEEERLVAMAGERMRLPGFCEISAVCVDQAARGRGLARALVARVAKTILARGETPFLHAYAENYPAIALYQSMGFRIRRHMNIVKLARVNDNETA
ncbi:MAG: GNAT family N-acetyltransferase [Pseudomonadota bacterium]